VYGPHFFNHSLLSALSFDEMTVDKSLEMCVGLLPILDGCSRFCAVSSDESNDRMQRTSASSVREEDLPGSKMESSRKSFIKIQVFFIIFLKIIPRFEITNH